MVCCKSRVKEAEDPSLVVTLLSIVFKTDSLSTLTPFTFEIALVNAFFKAISKVSPVPLAFVSIYFTSAKEVELKKKTKVPKSRKLINFFFYVK